MALQPYRREEAAAYARYRIFMIMSGSVEIVPTSHRNAFMPV